MPEEALGSALVRLALEAGFTETGKLDIPSLEHLEWVREICRGNSCRGYGKTWACPPAVGTLEECRERCRSYGHMLLLDRVFPLADSFDFEGMGKAMRDFKAAVDAYDGLISPLLPRRLLLSNEGCGRCRTCTWPEAPCRFPDRLHHSIEGYGFDVSRLAKQAGLKYSHGPGTLTFFGALLYGEPES